MIEQISDDPFFMSVFSMIFYFAVLYWIQSTHDKKLTFKEWFHNNTIQFIVGLMLAFAMVNYDDEILDAYHKSYDAGAVLPDYFYLGSGIWLNLVYHLFANMSKLTKLILKKFSLN